MNFAISNFYEHLKRTHEISLLNENNQENASMDTDNQSQNTENGQASTEDDQTSTEDDEMLGRNSQAAENELRNKCKYFKFQSTSQTLKKLR